MNKDIGDRYEGKLLQTLRVMGYWCHLFAYKPEGQPCDIVAIRDNIPFLIDVKHCEGHRFMFKDIRPNQRTCFALAGMKGNTNCGFAIFFEEVPGWRWLPYDDLCKMEGDGWRSVKEDDCQPLLREL